METAHKNNNIIKNAIAKESRKYVALLVVLFFSLILEVAVLTLVLLKHELVLEEPIHKTIFMCLIFIGTIWSLYSLIINRRKTVVKIRVKNNEIETTSIGSNPLICNYPVNELVIKKLPMNSKGGKNLVKICKLNEEVLFYCSSDFFDITELLKSESKFLNDLGEKLMI